MCHETCTATSGSGSPASLLAFFASILSTFLFSSISSVSNAISQRNLKMSNKTPAHQKSLHGPNFVHLFMEGTGGRCGKRTPKIAPRARLFNVSRLTTPCDLFFKYVIPARPQLRIYVGGVPPPQKQSFLSASGFLAMLKERPQTPPHPNNPMDFLHLDRHGPGHTPHQRLSLPTSPHPPTPTALSPTFGVSK